MSYIISIILTPMTLAENSMNNRDYFKDKVREVDAFSVSKEILLFKEDCLTGKGES